MYSNADILFWTDRYDNGSVLEQDIAYQLLDMWEVLESIISERKKEQLLEIVREIRKFDNLLLTSRLGTNNRLHWQKERDSLYDKAIALGFTRAEVQRAVYFRHKSIIPAF